MAARQWRFLGARTEGEAKSCFVSSCRRRVGCFVAREYAADVAQLEKAFAELARQGAPAAG